jgi:hypothetical protein
MKLPFGGGLPTLPSFDLKVSSMAQRFLEVAMSRKNIFEFSSQLIILAALCAGLVGCRSVQPLPTPTSTPILMPASPTTLQVETLSPTATEIPLFPLEGLRMAYIVDGNLYLQDSGNEPIQLTDSGEDHTPIFSDDGEKIVFFRGVPSS